LTHPDVPVAGGRQPSLFWRDGRADFNFGFSDLAPGRYLESWIPANLIYDKFRLTIEIRLRHALATHSLVTNASASEVERHLWRLDFPPTTTALSPMIELHPTSELRVQAERRGQRRIEVWKAGSRRWRVKRLAEKIGQWLDDNEQLLGPYLHGDRFVAFLQERGGMEYDGACTSSVNSMRHEVFHGWWAQA
jgi:hypothetical protein